MKKVLYILFTAILVASCSSKPNDALTITVKNPSSFDRLADMVEIPLDSIIPVLTLQDSTAYIVKNSNGDIIPSQVTYNRYLIFQAGVKANDSITYTISVGDPQEYKALTYGRLVPERLDDFMWENDKVGFRLYGQALMAKDGPSNGIDLFYKRTNDIVIDNWYEKDIAGKASYHEDHGEGLDTYMVGRSLGAGSMAPYAGDKLWLNENFTNEEVLENGPLRTTFKLTYKNIDVEGKSIAENRTISIDAGSQLSRISQAYTIKEPLQVAAGFVKREKNDSIIAGDNYLVYAEPKNEIVDNVYLGIIFPQGMSKHVIDTYQANNKTFTHILGITTQQPKVPVTYYTGFGWSKFGFDTVGSFETYIKNFAEGLKHPLVIKYE